MPKRNLSIMGREGGVSRVARSLQVDLPRKLPPETIAREGVSPEDLALQKGKADESNPEKGNFSVSKVCQTYDGSPSLSLRIPSGNVSKLLALFPVDVARDRKLSNLHSRNHVGWF